MTGEGPILSDTGPLHYLVLIDAIDILPTLFERIVIPEAVWLEPRHAGAPRSIRDWLDCSPEWLSVVAQPSQGSVIRPARGAGERAAIALAFARRAKLLLMDDRAARRAASAQGIETIGTIGLLARAEQRGLLDFRSVAGRLRSTNFRCPPELFERPPGHNTSS